MEDVIETMTGVEIVDEDDVAVDMQVLAKEKSRLMNEETRKLIFNENVPMSLIDEFTR